MCYLNLIVDPSHIHFKVPFIYFTLNKRHPLILLLLVEIYRTSVALPPIYTMHYYLLHLLVYTPSRSIATKGPCLSATQADVSYHHPLTSSS
jgi:hypothetical protein